MPPTLLEDGSGLTFEYLPGTLDEAEFLYEEIFVRRSYLQHGVHVPERGSPLIVDAGANLGLFSLLALSINPRARVLAVELSPHTFPLLERNLFRAAHVRCVPALLRERPGKHELHCFGDAPAESTCHPRERAAQRARLDAAVKRGAPSAAAAAATAAAAAATSTVAATAVRAVTLSSLLEELGVERVDLLKVDCEGDELAVLRGISARHWAAIRQVVAEVHDINGRLDRVVALLRRHGFGGVICEPLEGGQVEGYHMVVPPTLRLFYVFATRDGEGVERGVKRRRGS